METEFTLNGSPTVVEAPDHELLIDSLRTRLRLTGTKRSCDVEICGACTVLRDGQAISACTTLTADVDGADVVTIEGLADGDELHPVQQAFVDHSAAQCGFCTPGMVMSVVALSLDYPDADEETIKEYLSSSLCRCTGYVKIIEAAQQVLEQM
jgi:carbon-monoxide dehydrogenase small subunit